MDTEARLRRGYLPPAAYDLTPAQRRACWLAVNEAVTRYVVQWNQAWGDLQPGVDHVEPRRRRRRSI